MTLLDPCRLDNTLAQLQQPAPRPARAAAGSNASEQPPGIFVITKADPSAVPHKTEGSTESVSAPRSHVAIAYDTPYQAMNMGDKQKKKREVGCSSGRSNAVKLENRGRGNKGGSELGATEELGGLLVQLQKLREQRETPEGNHQDTRGGKKARVEIVQVDDEGDTSASGHTSGLGSEGGEQVRPRLVDREKMEKGENDGKLLVLEKIVEHCPRGTVFDFHKVRVIGGRV